jgi:hypothetical protein
MSLDIELTLAEFAVAVQSTMTRMLVSAGQQLNHASTYKRTYLERLHEETVGCCAEMAMGKLVNRYFIPEVGTFHEKPDYLHDIEIRATSRLDGRLIVRDNDHNDRRYVFATVTGQVVSFHGWLYGYEAKKNSWLTNPNDYRLAWFVPQSALRPIETLELHVDAAAVAQVEQPA